MSANMIRFSAVTMVCLCGDTKRIQPDVDTFTCPFCGAIYDAGADKWSPATVKSSSGNADPSMSKTAQASASEGK